MTDPQFWNALADNYAAKPVDDPDAFERRIDITRGKLTPDAVLLDIGCGTGSLALRLASHAREVHRLDFSSEMVRHARTKAADGRVDNAHFHVGRFDSDFTAFGPESLDVLCCYSLLHLVEDRPALLADAFRRLRPGGWFVSSTVCLGESHGASGWR